MGCPMRKDTATGIRCRLDEDHEGDCVFPAAMTVAELIEALNAVQDKSKPVVLEGCDCVGDAGRVSQCEGWPSRPRLSSGQPDYVLIERLDQLL